MGQHATKTSEITYIAIELLNSFLSLFDGAHGHKPEPTTPVCLPVVDNLQEERNNGVRSQKPL